MHKRRRVIVKFNTQFKIIMAFLLVAAACLVIQGTLQTIAVAKFSNQLSTSSSPAAFASQLLPSVIKHSLWGIALLVPLTLVVGILVTFRVTGPIYRLERYFEAIARGEDPGTCRVRSGDECQELCALINEAMEVLRPSEDPAASGTVPAAKPTDASRELVDA